MPDLLKQSSLSVYQFKSTIFNFHLPNPLLSAHVRVDQLAVSILLTILEPSNVHFAVLSTKRSLAFCLLSLRVAVSKKDISAFIVINNFDSMTILKDTQIAVSKIV